MLESDHLLTIYLIDWLEKRDLANEFQLLKLLEWKFKILGKLSDITQRLESDGFITIESDKQLKYYRLTRLGQSAIANDDEQVYPLLMKKYGNGDNEQFIASLFA